MIVSRVDRKLPAECVEKDAKDEKRYQPQGKEIIEEVKGKLWKKRPRR